MLNEANEVAVTASGGDSYVSQSEAARMMGVSQRTLTRWWKAGDIPIKRFKKDRVVRFLRSDVEAYVRALTDPPPGDLSDEAYTFE